MRDAKYFNMSTIDKKSITSVSYGLNIKSTYAIDNQPYKYFKNHIDSRYHNPNNIAMPLINTQSPDVPYLVVISF